MTIQRDPEEVETHHLHKWATLGDNRVLEIGCGDGRLTWRYALTAREVAGIDLDSAQLLKARRESQPDFHPKVTFTQADSLALPFPSKQFDLAVFAWSF